MIVTDSTYDWLTWGLMDCPHGRLSPDLLARMEVHRTRAASLPLAAARLPIGWSYDSTLRRRSTADGVRLRSTWRRVWNASIQPPTTPRVHSPPTMAAGTTPSQAALVPARNSPSSLDEPMNSMFTAFTRPRMESGVENCTSAPRNSRAARGSVLRPRARW